MTSRQPVPAAANGFSGRQREADTGLTWFPTSPCCHSSQSSSRELPGARWCPCAAARQSCQQHHTPWSLLRAGSRQHHVGLRSALSGWLSLQPRKLKAYFSEQNIQFLNTSASGFFFPPSPTHLSAKHFFLDADRWNRFVSHWQKDVLLEGVWSASPRSEGKGCFWLGKRLRPFPCGCCVAFRIYFQCAWFCNCLWVYFRMNW